MTVTIEVGQLERDVDTLRAVHARVTALEPRNHLRPEHAGRLLATVVVPLRDALAEAIEITARIEQACDAGDVETGDWGEHLDDTGVYPAVTVASALSDQLWQQVGNLAFAARSELRRAERALLAEDGDHDRRVVAAESARRKLRRAIHAVVVSAGHALGREYTFDDVGDEIEAAAAVRRMYAKFRRSLPACDIDDPAQVRRALRLAAVSVAIMVGSIDFGEVRAQDRQLIEQLQQRILGWAREGAGEQAGRQLYQDLQTAADLLRAIDQRQELVAHDQAWMQRIAGALASGGAAEAIVADATPALHSIAGRDDELDAIAKAALQGEAAASVVARLRARLGALGWYPPVTAAA